MSLQALCTVAISSTLDSRAYQCRTHSEAHKVLLRQYRRWCATCFGRRTWWQRYESVSPHLDLNILFVETYQITLIWYFYTRPLQSLNSEPVNISGRSQASLVFSDLHLFSFWGSFPFQRSRVPIVLSYLCWCGSPSSWWPPSLLLDMRCFRTWCCFYPGIGLLSFIFAARWCLSWLWYAYGLSGVQPLLCTYWHIPRHLLPLPLPFIFYSGFACIFPLQR